MPFFLKKKELGNPLKITRWDLFSSSYVGEETKEAENFREGAKLGRSFQG